jgi:phosphate transport system permease protein
MSGAVMQAPALATATALRLGRRRRRIDVAARILALLATLVALAFLASILITLLYLGVPGLSVHMLFTVTRAPGASGGLANAIVGSVVQAGLGTLIGTPIGLMAGTYLAEYSGRTTLGNAVRFVSDILLSAPSILIGLFIYQVLVAPFGGFSGFAGAVALSILVIPIVVRTTEDMLRLIPVSLREASIALRWMGC